jgi:hypothetical protein
MDTWYEWYGGNLDVDLREYFILFLIITKLGNLDVNWSGYLDYLS